MHTKKLLGNLKAGDVLLNEADMKPYATVRNVQPARAKGYVVVEFESGGRTSGHRQNEVFVKGN